MTQEDARKEMTKPRGCFIFFSQFVTNQGCYTCPLHACKAYGWHIKQSGVEQKEGMELLRQPTIAPHTTWFITCATHIAQILVQWGHITEYGVMGVMGAYNRAWE
jgi:hypothetical protein